MCIGEPLARTEGVLILAEILRRFQLLRTSHREIGINPRVTIRPDQAVILALQPRKTNVARQFDAVHLSKEFTALS